MSKKDHAEIVCIIDRSGSMATIQDDAIGGFNKFLEEQRKTPGTAVLTYVQFDHFYETIHEERPLEEVPALDSTTFVPRGSTALNDAVGRTIKEVGARLAARPDSARPETVVVCVLTDGQENSSKEFTTEQVREMVQHQQEKYNWQFFFLSANPSAWEQSSAYGFKAAHTMAFAADSVGTQQAYGYMARSVSESRTGDSSDSE